MIETSKFSPVYHDTGRATADGKTIMKGRLLVVKQGSSERCERVLTLSGVCLVLFHQNVSHLSGKNVTSMQCDTTDKNKPVPSISVILGSQANRQRQYWLVSRLG